LMRLKLPNCEDLPQPESPEAANCIRIGIPMADPINKSKWWNLALTHSNCSYWDNDSTHWPLTF
jgi:hypothetical protein